MGPDSNIDLGRMLRFEPTDTLTPLYTVEDEQTQKPIEWPKVNPLLVGQTVIPASVILNIRACFDSFIKALKNTQRCLRLNFLALPNTPPRVRHLARHTRKRSRTRKKNENRALREYELRRKRQNDRT